MILRATRLSATGNNSSFRLDSDAEAYINEILLSGANPTFGQRNQINAFVLAEKSSNRWSSHRRIYFPVWGVAAANAVDMVTRTSGSFGGGVTHGAGFVQGNGTSGFFDMLVTPVAAGLAPGNACYWAHILQAGSGTGFRGIHGTTQVGSRLLTAARNAGVTTFGMGDTSGGVGAQLAVTDSDGRGIYIASETATNSRFLRVRRSSGIALSTTGTTVPTNPTFATVNQRVFCWNNNNSNSGFTDAQLSGYGLSLALSTADADAFTANLLALWENVVFEGFDPDAVDFIRATGASDYQAINNWVVGLKNLGIWNNVVCWPMRSTQNHGSGTVLRSLGGLGSFNGTLTNGPTWGANGIVFDGVNDFVNLPSFTADETTSLFYCASFASLSGAQKIVRINSFELGKAETITNGVEATWLTSPAPQIGRNVAIPALTTNLFHTATAIANLSTTSLSRFYNAGSKITNSSAVLGLPQQTSCVIGSRVSGNSHFNGTAAIASYINIPLSDAEVLSLHNLYRDTLGAGLGLP